LNKGDITNREFFEFSPFNNSTVIYEMTVIEIKNFLKGFRSGFYFSGINIVYFKCLFYGKRANYFIVSSFFIPKFYKSK
jgi:hypothetical protein